MTILKEVLEGEGCIVRLNQHVRDTRARKNGVRLQNLRALSQTSRKISDPRILRIYRYGFLGVACVLSYLELGEATTFSLNPFLLAHGCMDNDVSNRELI